MAIDYANVYGSNLIELVRKCLTRWGEESEHPARLGGSTVFCL